MVRLWGLMRAERDDVCERILESKKGYLGQILY